MPARSDPSANAAKPAGSRPKSGALLGIIALIALVPTVVLAIVMKDAVVLVFWPFLFLLLAVPYSLLAWLFGWRRLRWGIIGNILEGIPFVP